MMGVLTRNSTFSLHTSNSRHCTLVPSFKDPSFTMGTSAELDLAVQAGQFCIMDCKASVTRDRGLHNRDTGEAPSSTGSDWAPELEFWWLG